MKPSIDVFGWPVHVEICAHRFAQPHVFGVAPPPHVVGASHVPQLGVSPPQPSPTTPHVAFASAQLRGVQV